MQHSFFLPKVRIQKLCSEFLNFEPLLPLFIPVCFTCTLNPPSPIFVCFSELPLPSQRNFCNNYELSNEKSGSQKREPSVTFCNL